MAPGPTCGGGGRGNRGDRPARHRVSRLRARLLGARAPRPAFRDPPGCRGGGTDLLLSRGRKATLLDEVSFAFPASRDSDLLLCSARPSPSRRPCRVRRASLGEPAGHHPGRRRPLGRPGAAAASPGNRGRAETWVRQLSQAEKPEQPFGGGAGWVTPRRGCEGTW